jgi:hypothetical protein
MGTEVKARQGERRAAGAVVATTQPGQANRKAAARATAGAAMRVRARIAEQVEDGFDGDL